MIEDENTQVFVPLLSEHEDYTKDVIEDYIYDIFARKIDMQLTVLWIMKSMICDELHLKNSPMKTRSTREYLCEPMDVYRFYHRPYKDHMTNIRDEWIEEYELQ